MYSWGEKKKEQNPFIDEEISIVALVVTLHFFSS